MMGVGPFGPDSDLLTMTSARWDHAFAITLRGQMLACKHALTPMLAQGSGSIVNVSSASALRGDLVRIAYGTAKGGRELANQACRNSVRQAGYSVQRSCARVGADRGSVADEPGVAGLVRVRARDALPRRAGGCRGRHRIFWPPTRLGSSPDRFSEWTAASSAICWRRWCGPSRPWPRQRPRPARRNLGSASDQLSESALEQLAVGIARQVHLRR